ncbi:hypothetical protein MRB53_011254 [Persea americana]|uniref:Uncharacterized protein n=1 Tax=Persea americana TaxID=3435 RepID=A0ACC2LU40_PERAE|nr:hypothetical protein MRB53_011254 [Persea americana]
MLPEAKKIRVLKLTIKIEDLWKAEGFERPSQAIWLEMANNKYEYVKSFEPEDELMPLTWIVVRIDGHRFHRFCEVHEFEKPNDEQALNLMNSCAKSILEEFPDIVFAYGVSDEYSFILKKTTRLCQRHSSKILSLIVSYFTSAYVMKWREFFPQKELKYPPSFDGRVICYPSTAIVRDYLAWRQVDCHINNQYNTCYWMLVKSGKSKREAQDLLKGTQTQEKNEILLQHFSINYNTLPVMFRKGSSVFRDKVEDTVDSAERGDPVEMKVVIDHSDIIEETFWDKHQYILDEEHIRGN